MKKQLQKKLSGFIITAMLFSASANAQIVYTDVNPDVTSGTGFAWSYNLDLTNDGTNDFVITHSITLNFCTQQPSPINDYIKVTPSGTNRVADSSNNVTKMALNANINASVLTWNNSANQLMASKIWLANSNCFGNSQAGQWINAVDGYLGLKLISGGNTYYGWVRISTSNVSSFTVKDYAYNSTPNQTILAGDTINATAGIIENSFASSIHLYPNPATDKLTIAIGSCNKKIEVTIADITGKIIFKTAAFAALNIEVDTKDFPAGIYVVQIQSADFIATKKLVVEK